MAENKEIVEMFTLPCPECKCTDAIVLGVRDEYLYLQCLNDDCGITIRWSMRHLAAISYPAPEEDFDETIRFEVPDKGNNGKTE